MRIKSFGFPDLRELTLTSAVRVIDKGAFDACTKLTTIHFTGSREDWIRIKDAFSENTKVILTESFVNADVEQEEENAVTFAASYKETESDPEIAEEKQEEDIYEPQDTNVKLARFLLTFFLGFIGSFIINHSDLKPKGYSSRTAAYLFLAYFTFGIYPLVASISNFFFDPKKKRNIGYIKDEDDL